MSEGSVLTVVPGRHPLWFDEAYYRNLIKHTVGAECYTQLAVQGVDLALEMEACLCLLYCYHRAMTAQEVLLRTAILEDLSQVVRQERLRDKWPFILSYTTVAVIGVMGNRAL